MNLAFPNTTYTSSNKPSTTTLKSDLSIIETEVNSLLQSVYPVGSIYINASVATNPAILLGFGTWTAFGAGRVMVGLDAGQTEFDTLEETGGAKTHTLTSAESGLPAHSHEERAANIGAGAGGLYLAADAQQLNGTGEVGINTSANTAANASSAHNNLQPYIVVKMWKRDS
jgi:hypothetical protein